MRLVLISDTHGATPDLPGGDVLVHAGDLSMKGTLREIKPALAWLGGQPHDHVVVIAGNHDFIAEDSPSLMETMCASHGLTYLNDSGTTIDGVKFWGSPVQPWFHDWAFNRQRGRDIRKHWGIIPKDTDVLITHGPPYGILDRTVRTGEPVGCADLLEAVERVKPVIHVFGHIHEGYGVRSEGGTDFYNASIMNLQYRPLNAPIVVEL